MGCDGARSSEEGSRDPQGGLPAEPLAARELLGPDGTVRIQHGGQIYTLRLTRNNRLILTK